MFMGAGFSGIEGGGGGGRGLGELPESCVACVLSRMEASEICRVARVNTTFHRASLSDSVWESKLPENHEILLKKVFGSAAAAALTKKDIYKRFATPFLFASHTKEVWLDKRRGGISVAISWKAMKITGIDDRRYWTHVSTNESRFGCVAYLHQTWWLEIAGSLELEFPVGAYSLFFRLRIGRPSYGGRIAEKIHGWDVKPVTFQLESSNSGHAKSERFFNQQPRSEWVYHHVGDFVVQDSNTPTSLNFSMTQIDCTHTKGGLCVDSVFVFPTTGRPQPHHQKDFI
ncbi:F-box protein PP2-A13-like [Salvia miltiorrhiza]|uniref:F-box protein PP2-A13-like n=1 Tax=Salvia miltiorrhiza TaxID=226208 RepID=UPI0025AC6724|nr:F-box protein PP2-A13-like [Salvia miltiorrhiza]